MLFYDKVEALDSQIHGDWTISPKTNWLFTKKAHVVPLLTEEFAMAQADYIIAFARDELSDHRVPVALLGLKNEQNLFVTDEGQWQKAAYIPAYVRRFPFAPGLAEAEAEAEAGAGAEKMLLLVETSSGTVGPFGEGEPLFINAQPARALRQALELVEAYHRQAKITENFCRYLEDLDLLTNVTFETPKDAHRLEGLFVIDEKKFDMVNDETLLNLFKSGYLTLIYAHLMSLKNTTKYGP